MRRQKRIRVGIIFGGRSPEHEVSIVSARYIIQTLDSRKYQVVPIAITKEGKWLSSPDALHLLESQSSKLKGLPERILIPNPQERGLVTLGSQDTAPRALDVIFPVVHGPYGEDGTLQGLFELADIPYVGAGVLGSSCGMDKDIMKRLFVVARLPVVEFISFTSYEWSHSIQLVRRKISRLGYPVFVKPANMGSSVGISKVHSPHQLVGAIRIALRYDRKAIVEKAVPRARDIECAVIGNNNPRVSVPGEIISSNEFYDYDAKYVDGKSQAVIPAKLDPAVRKSTQKMAIAAFQALDLSGMARVDFLLSGNRLYVNEVNTIPGFTEISMFPKLWEASGLKPSKLIERLIQDALLRHNEKRILRTSFTPKTKWFTKKDSERA